MVVLMCFVGHDYQRILDGVNYWRMHEPIEAIYLFYDKKRDSYGYASRRNAKDLERALTFAGSKPRIIGINPQDYEDVFSSFYMALKKEVIDNNRKVLIDATSTTKEAYGAAVTVSLMFPKVGIYIVPPAERGWYIPQPGTPEYEEWFRHVRMRRGTIPQQIFLPGNRLEHPSLDEMKILLALIEHGGKAESIKSVIKWCGDDPSNPAVKNKYSRLVSKLISKGFTVQEPSTRTKRIRLTGFGKVFAKALKLIASDSQPRREAKPTAYYSLSDKSYELSSPLTPRNTFKNYSLEDAHGKIISSRQLDTTITQNINYASSMNEFTSLLNRLAIEFREIQ